jgi:rRNA maturation endonuclease Nob1
MNEYLILILYGGLGIGLVYLGVIFYARAVASRKRYFCPRCREQMTVELMEAGRCNQCGAPLEREP